MFENAVPASQETLCPSITKINLLMWGKETIAVYFKNRTPYIRSMGKMPIFLILKQVVHIVTTDALEEYGRRSATLISTGWTPQSIP
jgi:hypothetical protein